MKKFLGEDPQTPSYINIFHVRHLSPIFGVSVLELLEISQPTQEAQAHTPASLLRRALHVAKKTHSNPF